MKSHLRAEFRATPSHRGLKDEKKPAKTKTTRQSSYCGGKITLMQREKGQWQPRQGDRGSTIPWSPTQLPTTEGGQRRPDRSLGFLSRTSPEDSRTVIGCRPG